MPDLEIDLVDQFICPLCIESEFCSFGNPVHADPDARQFAATSTDYVQEALLHRSEASEPVLTKHMPSTCTWHVLEVLF